MKEFDKHSSPIREVFQMKRMIGLLVGLAILGLYLMESPVAAEDWDDVVVTRDPSGRKLTSYTEYMEKIGAPGPFQIERVWESGTKGTGNILIIVNSTLWPSVAVSISQYQADLVAAGHTVSTYTTSGGTPANLRSYIQSQSTGLVGVVLVGDLPIPWFEIGYDFDGADPDNLDDEYADFPCDLFYMDLDGTWADNNSTYPFQYGVFDDHSDGSGDRAPEIWVSRLTASPMTHGGATEVGLVNNYFTKNHSFREGDLYAQERALVYVDDDWYGSADQYGNEVGLAYPSRVLVKDKATTCRADYHDVRLSSSYEWMHVMLHSSWYEHYFKVNDVWEENPPGTFLTVDAQDIENADPVAIFYDLFCCSNCRYVETDYEGGWYIFVPNHGLGAVGTTKTGGMLNYSYYYTPLSQGKSLGQAMKEWLAVHAPFDSSCVRWYYGMTLLGDGALTLRPRIIAGSPGMNALGVSPNAPVTLTFDRDMKPATLGLSTFRVFGSRSGPHTGAYNYDSGSRTFTFTPSQSFIDGEVVTAVLCRKAKCEDNVPPRSEVWDFNVGVGNPTPGTFSVSGNYAGVNEGLYSNDFNGDGYPDLASVYTSSDELRILLNSGSGSFPAYQTLSTNDTPRSIAGGDFNGDGDLDLAVMNSVSYSGNPGMGIYTNNGSGVFTGPTSYNTFAYPTGIVTGDFNGDRYIDVVVISSPNSFQHWVQVFENDGWGTFGYSNQQYFSVTGGGLALRLAGDVDGDGDLDLVFTQCGDYGVADDYLGILYNDGDANFSLGPMHLVPDGPAFACANDLDGDGDLDVAVTSAYTDTLCVCFNDGTGQTAFDSRYYVGGSMSYSACTGDWDGDGDIDLVQTVQYPNYRLRVLKNNGSGAFMPDPAYTISSLKSVAPADFDRDGDVDLAVSGGGPLPLTIMENDGTADVVPPAAVTNLATLRDTSVTLGWTAPGDDGSVGRARQYDLRYSTTEPGGDMGAWWAAATAVTNEPVPSIAGTQESCTVDGLEAGNTYYFVLRSADEVPNWSGYSNTATVTIQTTDVADEVFGVPVRYQLSQNRPNPFNPVTQIEYTLPRECHVTLDVFNIRGQRVATLVDDYQDVGVKQVTWHADHVSSGIYYYRLTAGDFSETRRMVLLR